MSTSILLMPSMVELGYSKRARMVFCSMYCMRSEKLSSPKSSGTPSSVRYWSSPRAMKLQAARLRRLMATMVLRMTVFLSGANQPSTFFWSTTCRA